MEKKSNLFLKIVCIILIGIIGYMMWEQNIQEKQTIQNNIEHRQNEFQEMRRNLVEEAEKLEAEALEAISKNDHYRVAQLEVELDKWLEDYESYEEEYSSFKNEKREFEEQVK